MGTARRCDFECVNFDAQWNEKGIKKSVDSVD